MLEWRPTITNANLNKRSAFLQKIRDFFARRNIIEVTTPILSRHTVTSLHIASIPVPLQNETFYLQTSPEYAMKRLLANGAPSIYQICPAIRNDENGTLHNTEFTMLEWYEINKSYIELMHTVDELMQAVLNTQPAIRISYSELFKKHLNIHPLQTEPALLCNLLADYNISGLEYFERSTLLGLLMSNIIEPQLIGASPWLVYDYPAHDSMLATLKTDDPNYAERFELYYQGIELGNAYNECADPVMLRHRFNADNMRRKQHNLPMLPLDERFLQAMEQLPPCSGIAIGLDRLFMCHINSKNINDAIAFPLASS